MRAGETDVALIEINQDLLDIGKKIAQSLRHIGNLDVDCFISGGKIIILEMNCRFGGQYPFSHEAGVKLPAQIIEWHLGLSTNHNYFKPQTKLTIAKDISLVKLNEDC
jgi:carbamoyl-phosphate synthase large subunit